MYTTLNDETDAQRAAREHRAQENASRSKELSERDVARRERAKAEREEEHQKHIQSEGLQAWQILREARIDRDKAAEDLQAAEEHLAYAQKKYDALVTAGYIDTLGPLLEKQEREKQTRESAERVRRGKAQADAIANSNRTMSFEERERINAEIREKTANPTERLCPGCKTHVQLVNGQLPEEHAYRFRNEFGEVEKRICHPFE